MQLGKEQCSSVQLCNVQCSGVNLVECSFSHPGTVGAEVGLSQSQGQFVPEAVGPGAGRSRSQSVRLVGMCLV